MRAADERAACGILPLSSLFFLCDEVAIELRRELASN